MGEHKSLMSLLTPRETKEEVSEDVGMKVCRCVSPTVCLSVYLSTYFPHICLPEELILHVCQFDNLIILLIRNIL